jgi:uncharacterized protein (DUF3820 family)
MISREDKLKMFINEIGDIKDANLKAFATELIANADDYFFVVPASSSGKYHPPFDLGDGGLVRHTRLVAYMARSLAESYCFSDYDTDCLIVAALAHDIKKQGNGDTGHTVWDHPILAMHYVQEIYGKTNFNVPADTIEKISNAVSSHMGKWGNEPRFCKGNTPLPMPVTEFDKALQAADYVASRKEIIDFKFRDTEEVNIVAQPKSVLPPVNEMSLFELENYQMPFGKHKGKTLREVKPTGYLDWMLKQTDFANKDTQEIVRAYFNKLRESVTSDGREKVKEENKAYVAENASQSLPIDEDDLPF